MYCFISFHKKGISDCSQHIGASISDLDKSLHPKLFCGMYLFIHALDTCFWDTRSLYDPFDLPQYATIPLRVYDMDK